MGNIIMIEGADNVGKSTIGKALAKRIHYDYFKMSRSNIFVKKEDPKIVEAMHAFQIESFYNFSVLVNFNVILDRFYLSEIVYGKLFRKIDEDFLWEYDKKFAKLNLKLIVLKKDENKLEDELWTNEQLCTIQRKYVETYEKSACDKILIDTSNEDLESQLSQIINFLKIKQS